LPIGNQTKNKGKNKIKKNIKAKAAHGVVG